MNLAQSLSVDQHTQQIYLLNSEHGRIEIHHNEQYLWMTIDGVIQSAIERTPPYRPVLPHCWVMLLPLLHDKAPTQVLELGGGGQAMQRYLQLSHPAIDFISVELNPDVIHAVHQCFPSSDHLNIVQQDAFDFIEHCVSTKRMFDWILVDLFHGRDTGVSDEHKDFFQQVDACLRPGGWLITNSLYPKPETREALCQRLHQTFNHRPYLFAVPEMQNYIILLHKSKTPVLPDAVTQHDLYRRG